MGSKTKTKVDDNVVYEVARFQVRDGVSDEDVIAAAETLQSDFLVKYDGVVYRELMKAADSTWLDTVHWESVGDFAESAADVLTDPGAAGLMALIDMSSLAWFHAFRSRHWSKTAVPAASGANDLHMFRLVGEGAEIEGLLPASDEEFAAAAETAQASIEVIDGFVDRELLRTLDGWWLDLTHWADHQAADAARHKVAAATAAGEEWTRNLFGKIDPKSLQSYALEQKRTWSSENSQG